MELSELERDGLIQKLPADRKKVRDTFKLAERDLRTARDVTKTDYDWAFSIAYNSMLQASRALMFSMGYRSHGSAQHISAVKFVETVLGDDVSESIVVFDRMRRKRHIAVYGAVGLISKTESKNALDRAEKFLKKIREILREKGFIEADTKNPNGQSD